MCGRYSLTTPVDALRALFGFAGPPPNLPARYNIAPTQEAPVVRRRGPGAARELALLRWGLVPSWADGPRTGYRMINARAETVARKPAFRAAFRRRRCLVPADGFYEWRAEGKRKQPYRVAFEDGAPFAFAGLWERWRGADGGEIESFAIVVTDANALLRPIHDRMPVILAPDDHEAWLTGEDGDALSGLLRPHPGTGMIVYPVSPRVNDPRNDDRVCVEPLAAGSASA